MIALYIYFSQQVVAGVVAAVVMLILGFFFATVSGSLCGLIGSSNNPVSGLTLSTLLIAALLMVALGVSGPGGVAAVLGVAAVVCVSSAVAGELLQDFKVGYILGGTPRNIQVAELLAVVVASLVMYFPLLLCTKATSVQAALVSAVANCPLPKPVMACWPRHRGRRYALAPHLGRHLNGLRLHRHECQKPHVSRRRYVSAV